MLIKTLHACSAILLVLRLLNVIDISYWLVIAPSAIALIIDLVILIVSIIILKLIG